MKIIILFFVLVLSSNSWAIKYVESSAGAIKEIDATSFDKCSKIFYRNVAKSELTTNHQKNLVKATLKGELVNDIEAVIGKLKSENGACTYADNAEKI